MKSIEQIDRWIAMRVKGWTQRAVGQADEPALLEIRRDILENVRDHIEPLGGGRSAFPYNYIIVHISGADRELYRASLEAECALEEDIRSLLEESQTHVPAAFSIAINTGDPTVDPSGPPFRIECLNRARDHEPNPQRRNARITIISGEADPREFAVTSDRVNMGRLREVVSQKDGLRRRNDIAFTESETSVSREHASIRYDPEQSRYRISDNKSQRGTNIFRDGRRIEVPRGGPGVQLHSGDEIHLGDARLRFDLEG